MLFGSNACKFFEKTLFLDRKKRPYFSLSILWLEVLWGLFLGSRWEYCWMVENAQGLCMLSFVRSLTFSTGCNVKSAAAGFCHFPCILVNWDQNHWKLEEGAEFNPIQMAFLLFHTKSIIWTTLMVEVLCYANDYSGHNFQRNLNDEVPFLEAI